MPPSSDPMGSSSISFNEDLKNHTFSCSSPSAPFSVQEAPSIFLLMGQEVEDEDDCFR
jgi:hypothetical protein